MFGQSPFRYLDMHCWYIKVSLELLVRIPVAVIFQNSLFPQFDLNFPLQLSSRTQFAKIKKIKKSSPKINVKENIKKVL